MSIHKFNTDIQHEGRLIVERVADISVLPYDSTSSVTDEARILYDEATDNLYYGTISTFKPIQSGAEPFTKVIDVAGGGDYSSIATAVSTEPAGTSFFIKSGTYTETVIITKSGQSLIGESESGVILNGSLSLAPTIVTTVETGSATVTNGSTTVTDGSATFQSGGHGTGSLISLNGIIHKVASVTDDTNLELTIPWRGTTEAASVVYVLNTEYVENATIKNIHINGTTATAMLLLSRCYNCDVSNIELNGPGTTGLGSGFSIENNSESNRVQIDYVQHSEQNGVGVFSSFNILEIGYIANCNGNGIHLSGATDNTISVKSIFSNTTDGIDIHESNRNTFIIGQCMYNQVNGIDFTLDCEDNVIIADSIINNNLDDLSVTVSSGVTTNSLKGGTYGSIDLNTATSTILDGISYTTLTGGTFNREVSIHKTGTLLRLSNNDTANGPAEIHLDGGTNASDHGYIGQHGPSIVLSSVVGLASATDRHATFNTVQSEINSPLNFREILGVYTSIDTPVSVDSSLTLLAETVIICDSTSAMEVDLPVITALNEGKKFIIKNINASSPGVTVDANGSDVVETIAAFGTAATDSVTAGDAITYVADNTNKTWWLI